VARRDSGKLPVANDHLWRRIQPVDATDWLNLSAGVW
jgi:hypothetical protein